MTSRKLEQRFSQLSLCYRQNWAGKTYPPSPRFVANCLTNLTHARHPLLTIPSFRSKLQVGFHLLFLQQSWVMGERSRRAEVMETTLKGREEK